MVELERRKAAIFVNHTVRIALCTAATVIPVASWVPQSDYLTRLERDIVAEHNLARSDPALTLHTCVSSNRATMVTAS